MGTKQPKTWLKPEAGGGGRTPKALPSASAEGLDRYPVFSFEVADRTYSGNWAWPSGEEASALLEFLCEMGRRTWKEIRADQTGGRNRHRKHHEMPIDAVCADAQARITKLRLQETFEDLFRFRLSGTNRLWGFEQDGLFYVLWWDATHQVYPTDK